MRFWSLRYVEKRIYELGLNDIFFLKGAFSPTEMPYFFSCADALIVSLKKEKIFSYTIPSKIQTYLACGKPIIGSLDGEGAKIISEANAGFASPAEDDITLADNIIKFMKLNEAKKEELGANAKKYFDKEFDREFLLTKLEEILKN